MNLSKEVVSISVGKSMVWSFLERGSAALVNLVVQIVLARILSPDTFGQLAILLVITNVADSIAQSGLGTALIQDIKADDASFNTAFWLSLSIAIVLYFIMFICAPFIASFYSMPSLAPCLRVLSLSVIVNSANSIQRSYLQKTMNFRGLFKITFIASSLSGVAGIAAAMCGLELWSLVIQNLLLSIISCIIMYIAIPLKIKFIFIKNDAKRLFQYGWKICITGVLNVFYTGVSELIIGKSCSAFDLGMYSQGRKYPNAAIGVATNSITNVLFPAFSSIKDKGELFAEKIRKALSIGSFVVIPVVLLLAETAEPLVALLLGEKWLPCVPIFQLTCIGNIFLMMQLVDLRAYMALGESGVYLKLQIIKVLNGIIVIGGTAFISHNINITALAVCLVSLFNNIIVDTAPANRLLSYSRGEQLRDQIQTLLLACFSAFIAWLANFLVTGYLFKFIIQTVVFCFIYLSGSKLVKSHAFEDFSIQIKQIMNNHKRK